MYTFVIYCLQLFIYLNNIMTMQSWVFSHVDNHLAGSQVQSFPIQESRGILAGFFSSESIVLHLINQSYIM